MVGLVSASARARHTSAPRLLGARRRLGRLAAAGLLGLGLLLGGVLPSAVAATAAPHGLEAASASTTSLTLSWTAVKGAPRYRVQYSTSASMAKAGYRRFTSPSGTLTGLEVGTRYYVKVRVITSGGHNLSSYSTAVSASTKAKTATAAAPTGSELRLGSFNIKCFSCIGDHPYERTWWDRRADVVSTILGQHVDVLGVQEASQGWLPLARGGKGQDLSQFEDLRNRLGGTWELANANRNNCVRAKSPRHCVYKDQGASNGTKILYDRDRVDLLDNGSLALTSATSTTRYMAWAKFRQRSTGKEFFLADAHLEPNKDWNLHVEEATQVAAEVKKRNTGNLPSFIVGDMNAHKNSLDPAGVKDNPVYDVFVDKSHYVDPLGNRSGTKKDTVGATVEHRINTSLSSFNDFEPVPSPLYFDANFRPNGTYIDYIFTSPGVRVPEWETVAKLDAAHHYVGPQASDHNMVRATVVLP